MEDQDDPLNEDISRSLQQATAHYGPDNRTDILLDLQTEFNLTALQALEIIAKAYL